MTLRPTHALAAFTDALDLEAESIRACSERLKSSEAQKIVQSALAELKSRLDRGAKIVLTGVGKSGKIAEKISATLASTGSLALYLHPTEGLHGDLGLIREGDAVIAISYTGNTEELVQLLPSLKQRKVLLIGIGGNAQSKLARECDFWIDAGVQKEACPHNLAPTASTTLALAIGDALAVSLMEARGFGAEHFARNHPGGSLGKRLRLKVEDVMHQGKDLPIVRATDDMETVISTATEKKLGGVLVLEGQALRGLITDGDLRRALKHREKLFTLRAKDIMSASPIVCSTEMGVAEALSLMRDRPSQISVLPVFDPSNHCVGLLRIHDLIQTL